MNTKFLEAFVSVAHLKSFRAAAEKLNVSQATISSRIATLEEEFQCRLFERDHNEVTLSLDGAKLLEKAERVLQSVTTLKKALDLADEPMGRIKIGVVESIIHTWLGSFLSELTKTYPKLEFELTAEPTASLHTLFAKGALDLILQTDPVRDEAVINLDLAPLQMGWVSRSDNDLVGRVVSLEEVSNHQIVTFTRGSRPHSSVLSMFDDADWTCPVFVPFL
ncbi:LysR family transcriptional regulator [Thalassobius sp. I31.1]|uniref:LysR family transcriptional regulator n=1 Tax=Thalassobius sp. I31.1 TaxID=2109912 RepID=UPI000D1BC46F|nr:LysR family transcriptional regulator [Thalassobius sp. I31.1]